MSVKMVDISGKEPVLREAEATGMIALRESTVSRIRAGTLEKGDVIAVAKVAAIQAVKRTPDFPASLPPDTDRGGLGRLQGSQT